ncbi:MAG: GNAT family N-acetyltransferase [Fibrobacteres bacterium]|nr:GNAT family N-acetyltransferase [Fibrobacterota bacterium]
METASIDRIAFCEHLAHRTWPSRTQENIGAWILRENEGFTRRANSCLALGDPGMAQGCAIDRVEAWYRQRGLEPCIKVCSAAPDSLDGFLESRGWILANPALVLSKELPAAARMAPDFVITDVPEARWLAHLAAWDGESADKATLHADLARRIPRAGFASWRSGEEIHAVATVALDPTSAHLYDLVVREDLRGRGIGGGFLESLLSWAKDQGADRAYLQVLESNERARRLYAKMGFAEHHRYHYRVGQTTARVSCGC